MYTLFFSVSYRHSDSLFQDDTTPIHEISLAFYGAVITIVVGSFLCYHLYLIS